MPEANPVIVAERATAAAAQRLRYTAVVTGQPERRFRPAMKSLFTTLGSLLVGGLIMLGIGGVAYHLFRENGWISQGLGALWNAQFQAPVMTVILIIAAIFVFKALRGAQVGNKRESKIPDFILFAFIATGIFFLGRLLTSGHI